eukprot:6556644-Prymnesium_polylepis.1
MLPSFLPKPLAKRVLLVGKAINYIRLGCRDVDWQLDWQLHLAPTTAQLAPATGAPPPANAAPPPRVGAVSREVAGVLPVARTPSLLPLLVPLPPPPSPLLPLPARRRRHP